MPWQCKPLAWGSLPEIAKREEACWDMGLVTLEGRMGEGGSSTRNRLGRQRSSRIPECLVLKNNSATSEALPALCAGAQHGLALTAEKAAARGALLGEFYVFVCLFGVKKNLRLKGLAVGVAKLLYMALLWHLPKPLEWPTPERALGSPWALVVMMDQGRLIHCLKGPAVGRDVANASCVQRGTQRLALCLLLVQSKSSLITHGNEP